MYLIMYLIHQNAILKLGVIFIVACIGHTTHYYAILSVRHLVSHLSTGAAALMWLNKPKLSVL